MDIDYDALRRLFLDESEEALNRMEIGLLRLEEAPQDREALAEPGGQAPHGSASAENCVKFRPLGANLIHSLPTPSMFRTGTR